MTVQKLVAFGGMIPALDERLLPENAAASARNCMLDSGAIVPIPTPSLLANLSISTKYVYRLPASYIDTDFLFGSTFMQFDDIDTVVIRAPVFDDQYDRYYWCSPSQPPKYNTRARINAGSPPYLLGIPAPTTKPTVVITGGTSTILESRAYLYTYVTAYGEEGPPSPPSTVQQGKIDATWTVTCTPPAAADTGPSGANRNITKLRIYRTVTSDAGQASYYRLVELTLPTVVYADTVTADILTQNSQLESTTWTGPPADLDGWVMMPRGIIAGWRGSPVSEIWFCEPYRPHAWPAQYVQTVEYPVVGLGVANQTLVACTQGYPATFDGAHPAYMSSATLMTFEPCISRGSILSTPEGVYYVSPNGLVLTVPGQASNITKDIISKQKWQQLVSVTRLRAARLGMSYLAYGTAKSQGVFQITAFDNNSFAVEDFTGAYTGVIIDPTSDRLAFSLLVSDTAIVNTYNDVWSGEVFIIHQGKLNWLDLVATDTEPQTAMWKSKVYQTVDVKNFAAAKIFFDTGILDKGVVTPDEYGHFRWWADDILRLDRPLVKSGELFRLPSGFKGDYVQFDINTKLRILNVQFATSAKELGDV